MKHNTKTMVKRWLALVLCLCMICPSGVAFATAAEELPEAAAYTGGLCEHHTQHTAECGYVEAVESQTCTHVHDENCGYQEPTEEIPCAHVHDDSCGYQAAVEEIPCDKGCTATDESGNAIHQEGCAYQPAVAEQPCTHTHDENCGYQAATEGSPCAHVHDENCGYVEAVDGQPCKFVCETCSGEKEEQDLLAEEGAVTISMTNPAGYVGEEYNLLEKATVMPEQDGDGNEIQLRIKDLEADPSDAKCEWNNPVLKVTENKNVSFTVTYEAYVELGDTDIASESEATEKVLATKQFTFPVYASGEIGDRLDGDYAYISDAYLVEDKTTDSGLAIRTGTAPWDDDDSAGNDSSAMNNTVRSFDVVTYTAAFKTQVRDGGPFTAYKTGTVYYEFVVEGTKDLVRFETESMGWMTAKTEGKHKVTEETHDGKTYQVLRGSFLAETGDGNPAAIGNSYQELNIALRVLAMTQGDTVKPQFTFWLEGNDVPESGLVTGSVHSCAEHGEQEYKTITAPDVSVTSAPRFNVQLQAVGPAYSYLGTFDFSTGNDNAANRDAGTKEGRAFVYGVTLQVQGKSKQHGLRGCELPDGSDITLNLNLSSLYSTDEGELQDLSEDYPLLLWSIEGNSAEDTQADGRVIAGQTKHAFQAAPLNKGTNSESCFNGGKWTGSQDGKTISITISDYEVDLSNLPWRNAASRENNHIYYDPNTISAYWEVPTACFSAGEIWLVQPFYDKEENYVANEEGSGTFTATVKDVNLAVKGESGKSLDSVTDNSNQTTLTDDTAVQTIYLTTPGSMAYGVRYMEYNNFFWSKPLTSGCEENGKDWMLKNGGLSIASHLSHTSAEGINVGVAYDLLIKFDDSFFQPDGTYQVQYVKNGENTVLFGAKADQTGWEHAGKEPNENGYDSEMMEATADDLIFFSSLEELQENGYTCVAVLFEARGVGSPQATQLIVSVNGSCISDAQSGSVYMCTVASKGWNKSDVQEAAAKYAKKDASKLTDKDYDEYVKSDAFPSRADATTSLSYEEDYPSSFWTYDYENVDGLRTYKKAIDDENGFVDATGGSLYGDSCLVVDYSTQITKSPNQPGTDEGGKKLTYDMDTSQREVDYVLYPTAVRSKGESTTEGTSTTTTVYVEDTLPEGLEYILNSAYYGGTYKSNGGGKAGTVTGGKQIHPEVTENDDGTTTLLFTLEDVTITADEVTQLEPIYYSCTIGTPGNEETDVVNQQQLVNSVKIWSDDEQIRDFVATNGNYAEKSIIISKNRAVSFSKTSDQKIVEVGEEMGFTIHHGNNSSNSMDVVDIDFLPYNGDGKGTQITGQVIVSELTVQSLVGNFKLYYTTDTSKQGTSAADYQASDFTKDNDWIEMTVDAENGAVTLPDVENVIVAVAAVGTLPANQTLKMHITFDVPDGKPGEYLVNSFCYDDMESNARTYIVNRLLEGVVWLDDDKDGLRESGETLMNGVKVTLMKKGEDGTYAPYLLNGKAVSVETGKQIDVLTGTVSDNAEGTYGFLHLPQGDFAVKFEDGETAKISDYTATQANVGTNDTIDSDAVVNEQDGKLRIEGIEMPEAKQITVQTYESRHHDLGLHTSEPETQPINIPVKKVWNDNNDQDGKRPDKITVKLLINGIDSGMTLELDEANGWQGTFEGLDQNDDDGNEITYAIEEVKVDGYETSITWDDTTGYTITNTHTPESEPEPATGSLKVSKTVVGNDGDTSKEFHFTVTLSDTSLSDTYGDMTFENGVASFALKHGESKTASGLPAGIRYTVTESDNSGYTVTAAGETGTIEADKTATAAFHNYRGGGGSDDDDIDVTVQKVWKLDDGGTAADSVTVTLYRDGKEYDTVNLNAQNGWRHTWYDLSDRYSWSVEETEVPEGFTMTVNQQGYTFTIVNDDIPDEPEEPDTPDEPDDPDDPDEPGKPTDPDDPDEPTTPTDPDEPDKPNPPKDDTPQTGDTTNLALWIGLLAISATGFTATLVLGKKKRYRGKHMR